MDTKAEWVLEADIESFFDSVDRKLLQEILRRRVRDGVLLRLVGKWLNAGVMELNFQARCATRCLGTRRTDGPTSASSRPTARFSLPRAMLTLSASITRLVKPSRALLVEHPFGLTMGNVHDAEAHVAVLAAMLEAAERISDAGTISALPFRDGI